MKSTVCQYTARVALYWITCSTLYFPVNTHPLKTLFHHLSLLHIWIVLLQSYSLWLSNILQDQMERDGEMNERGMDDKRRDSRATAPSKDNTVPCGYLLSPEFFFLLCSWTWQKLASDFVPNASIRVYLIIHVHDSIKTKGCCVIWLSIKQIEPAWPEYYLASAELENKSPEKQGRRASYVCEALGFLNTKQVAETSLH